MDAQENSIFKFDQHTQLEFLQKTVLVIDKSRFLVVKQLIKQNASDQEIGNFLQIPPEKVRCFKYKMTSWENEIRARRKMSKLVANKKPDTSKETAHDRFKKARELVARNYSVSEISKILKLSERSVTRFKKRMREEKRRLKAEGKLNLDPNDEDNSLKYLTEAEKLKKAKVLFAQGLKFCAISEICKVSERTVRRWKDRLDKMEQEGTKLDDDEEMVECIVPDTEDEQNEKPKPQRQRRPYFDREKVQYATELMNNGLSNKEMSMLLELSTANVRKLKANIMRGTIEELIDDSAEAYTRLKEDPLHELDGASYPVIYGSRRKPKALLGDREMHIVKLLRDRGVRTMDIAKLVNISERSVTRLIARAKSMLVHEYECDIADEVERLIQTISPYKMEVVNDENEAIVEEPVATENQEPQAEQLPEIEPPSQNFISKTKIGMDLIRMDVKVPEIAKMLEVSEKQVLQWKRQIESSRKEMKEAKKEIKEELNLKEECVESFVVEEVEIEKLDDVEEEYLEC